VHDGVIANPRPCPKCDYVADRPSKLSRHFIARHTTRRFQCAYGCPYGYKAVQGGLRYHLINKHRHKRKRYIMLALHKDDASPRCRRTTRCRTSASCATGAFRT
jgi:tRNA 2-selenouridine synthase SelU